MLFFKEGWRHDFVDMYDIVNPYILSAKEEYEKFKKKLSLQIDAITKKYPNIKTIALNGVANANRLTEEAIANNFKGYFVLCLDNDENKSGQKARRKAPSFIVI